MYSSLDSNTKTRTTSTNFISASGLNIAGTFYSAPFQVGTTAGLVEFTMDTLVGASDNYVATYLTTSWAMLWGIVFQGDDGVTQEEKVVDVVSSLNTNWPIILLQMADVSTPLTLTYLDPTGLNLASCTISRTGEKAILIIDVNELTYNNNLCAAGVVKTSQLSGPAYFVP